MRAVVFDEYGRTAGVREVPEPDCPAGAVVVRVEATGVCRSDWHAWKGHDPVALPHTPGHEFAGVVARVGEGVDRVQVGDRVTVPFTCGCGVCDFCRTGQAQVCPDQYQPGFTGPGSFAELVMVPAADTNVVVLPDEVDTTAAAALGCRFATAFRAVQGQGRVGPGQWLVVLGCGGVGLSAVMVGVALGARVVAVDLSPAALTRARELGAELTLDAADLSAVVERVREVTGGGAHVGVDAIGSPAVAAASVRLLRPRGRHVQVGLLLGPDAATALPMDLVVSRELEVLGSHGMAAADYPVMMALVADGRLDPASLVGRVIGLDEAGDALAAMDGPTGPGLTVVRLTPS
ncbi:zinc-dependent alcohol dehydrogenase family protein [Terracoccus luteus]|uniref:Alcohol dehydrogenase n=1 Tax=Terracoccus luteus TaxID=53356 RepID=A0A839Q079_9MICO|nr:zinc-dependent alcohol dehydrogenase family protein [Terracoccus luteus]MBB2986462.1 alcohol dehydrogenase [Terracoccus luteus]MCP2171949.1 alcohol dehydrogenase [Terracoccus luteus]